MAGLEKAAGRDHVFVGESLEELARCDLAEGRAAQAAARLERAIGIEEKAGEGTMDRGRYRYLLARALWSLGRRDDAVAAAKQAVAELGDDFDGAADLAAAQAWLHQRGKIAR
jgi:tetratricopeptide (TPR) repeat protein